MFMNDSLTDGTDERYSELSPAPSQVVASQSESDDYQKLLNKIDAARDGLAWGENDYDPVVKDDAARD